MKSDYSLLRDHCQHVIDTSTALIDDFLIYYAAAKDKIDIEFESKMSRFKDISREMPSSWHGMIKSQYIAYRIFRHNGLIHKYLKTAAVKARTNKEQALLKSFSAYPWRFCFSGIVSNPAPDFYEMEDVFTGEIFLLHSPAVTRTLSDQPVLLWFNLIKYNGACWQTFGPVISYQSFNADDIYFYATEMDPAIESEEDIVHSISNNPVRYMVLACGSHYPLIVQEGYEIVQIAGETGPVDPDVQALSKVLQVEEAKGILRASHQVWSNAPHFAEAYYEKISQTVTLFALTDKGFEEFAALLNTCGITIEPDVRLHVPMTTVIEKVLKRRVDHTPYSRLFVAQESSENQETMAKLNDFMALALPFINAGQQPDIPALAQEAGVDPTTAESLLKQAMSRLRKS